MAQNNTPIGQAALALLEFARSGDTASLIELFEFQDYRRALNHELVGRSCLLYAIDSGNVEMARALFAPMRQAQLNWRGDETPLEHFNVLNYAISRGQVQIANLLISNGAKPDVEDPYDNDNSPLHKACQSGRLEVCNDLLAFHTVKYAVDDENRDGRTPLSFAAKTGDERIVRLLLTYNNVNPLRNDAIGNNALFYSIVRGHRAIQNAILDSVQGKIQDAMRRATMNN